MESATMERATLETSSTGGCGCGGKSEATPHYPPVYAIGRVEARFPRADVEREFMQATGRAETTGKTDAQSFHAVLSKKENRYLARKMCWVFLVQGLETYLLQPRDPADLDLLLNAIRSEPGHQDLGVVVGFRGSMTPSHACNGLSLPIVFFDQLYSFTRSALVEAIPRPHGFAAEQFAPAAEELFDRVMRMGENAGANDSHRALNYLAMRYPAIYGAAVDAHARNCSLTSVETRPSSLAGRRNVVDVIFSFTHRVTDVTDKYVVRVDVTGEFPYLLTKLSPYYDH